MTWSIGASTGCCSDRPILEVLDSLHECGITAVELGTPPRHFDPWQHGQIAALRERLGATGIAPISIHAPFGGFLDLSDPNEHHRQAAVGGTLAAAAVLKELGGSIVVVHTTDVPRESKDVEWRLSNCAASLSVIARACRQMSMTLAVESPLPHLIGGHPDEFAWILQHVNSCAMVCLDTSHATLGHHWDRLMAVAGERLVHVHANDHRGRFDDHLPPGDGIIDWEVIRESLRGVGYRGWIMLELNCPHVPLPAHFSRARAQTEHLLG